METTALSETAVAVLRLRMKGLKLPIDGQRLEAYRELAAAGIMEPVAGADGTPDADFRFTEAGMERREEILRAEGERIERERWAPPDVVISKAARETLRRHLEGDNQVTQSNLASYRELARARIMYPLHGFVGGPEAVFRLTYWGYKLRFELAEMEPAEQPATLG